MNSEIMKQAGFAKEVQLVGNGLCPFCLLPIDSNEFKNEISSREFGISGLCQKCQDEMFG